MTTSLYQVDAFAREVFKGNPAAVCVLEQWPDPELMQQIANENNLSETAFVVRENDCFGIRWFTPEMEVELCGHATLAAAHVLFNHLNFKDKQICFSSRFSGILHVRKEGRLLTLDFPVDEIEEMLVPALIATALEKAPLKAYRGRSDFLFVFASEADIAQMEPDFGLLAQVGGRGIIVTAPGNDSDYVTRFFAPQSGIHEDPVTGSAQTTLVPYWSKVLGKKRFSVRQLSARGGELFCEAREDRVEISGEAITYMIGEIQL